MKKPKISIRSYREKVTEPIVYDEDLIKDTALLYELDAKDYELLKYLSKYPDMPRTKLAILCKISNNAVYHRVQRPAFKKAFDQILAPTRDLILRGAKAAFKRLIKIVEDDDADRFSQITAAKLLISPYVNSSMDFKPKDMEEAKDVNDYGEKLRYSNEKIPAFPVFHENEADAAKKSESTKDDTQDKVVRIFETTINPEGNLVQKIYEAEKARDIAIALSKQKIEQIEKEQKKNLEEK